ncbi:MAG: ABC transporter permease [Tannerella sp.]|jgi:lipoprotein-releasing system permease protein|nr:ABC transporter permease [Tannerella sp.]
MNFERFIAARLVRFSRQTDGYRASPPAIRIATAGIALGLATMILALAVVTGFKREVRDKVIGFGSHIRISNFDSNTSYETAPIMVSDTLMRELRAWPGIRRAEPFATKPGILKTGTDFQGIVLKGVDGDFDWTFFRKHLKEGDLPRFEPQAGASTDALLSRRLAGMLGLRCGDTFLAYFLHDDIRARRFRIAGIYDTGYTDYDRLFVIVDIRQVRRLNGWDDDAASGLALAADDYALVEPLTEQLYFHLIDRTDRAGNTYYVRSVMELNPMIFNWLSVLDVNVAVILALMMAVAGFTVISGLLIIILERMTMIGILKAMGQTDASLRRVFLHIASFLIARGMTWGNAIALTLCLLQACFHPLTLDPATYYLDAVPIHLSLPAWLLINAGTLLISMLMMLAPVCLIARIHPARSIRFE